jgi:glutamate-1-semialdehyde 2,1-aminomutase
MTNQTFAGTDSESNDIYARQWTMAAELYERATAVMPGGNTRTQAYVAPFPVYAHSARAATIELVDHTRVDDFLLNYTASALGHHHPEVTAAIIAAAERGGPYGIPSVEEVEFAEAICERFDIVQRLRFTSSGSEATMQALRCARAFKDRPLIAKAEGGYHGSHDFVDVSVTRFGETSVSAVAEARGTPRGVVDGVVVFPYNDLEAAISELDHHGDDLAAVIIEPVLNSGGSIPARPEFLVGLGEWCREHDVLLIADEVATWRTGYQGAAFEYGVTPDLICLGKPLGGGLPIGVFGGRADVMDQYDPRLPGVLRHAGTFNAHPLTMAAGLAVLEALTVEAVAEMRREGDRLHAAICEIGREQGVPLTSTQYGGFGRIHVAFSPPKDARQAAACPKGPRIELHRRMLERGVLIGHDGRYAISTATSHAQVGNLIDELTVLAPDVLAGVSDAPTFD